MSTTIRAVVARNQNPQAAPERTWYALAYVETETGQTSSSRLHYAHSHPEALQAAQVLRAELDAELMDEVHASRASRRAARVEEVLA